MGKARAARLVVSLTLLVAFGVVGAAGAFRTDRPVVGVGLSVLSVAWVVLGVAALRRRNVSADPKRSLVYGALGFGGVGIALVVVAVSDDDPVGRVLAGVAGAVGLALAGFMLWALRRASRHPELLERLEQPGS